MLTIFRFGAVCPWASFVHNDVISIYRLIFLGLLILLFRRLPVVFALHWNIWQIEEKQQAIFVGFFGPIGVSAVFYLYISLEFLQGITVDGVIREDAGRLEEVFTVVVWFLAVCSIVRKLENAACKFHQLTLAQVVHGLSIPIGKLGYHLPRTLSSAVMSNSVSEDPDEPQPPFHIRDRVQHEAQMRLPQERRRTDGKARDRPPHAVFRIGGSIIRNEASSPQIDKPDEEGNPSSSEETTAAQRKPDAPDDKPDGPVETLAVHL